MDNQNQTQVKILPTVGRVVYFKTRGSADGIFPPTNFASIITKVYTETKVSLVTFGESGVRFEIGVEQGDQPGQWDWMPFQKDQQARLYPTPDQLAQAREAQK